MPDWWWSAEERALSYRVLRLLRDLGDARSDRWVSTGTLSEHLGIEDPDDKTLYRALRGSSSKTGKQSPRLPLDGCPGRRAKESLSASGPLV